MDNTKKPHNFIFKVNWAGKLLQDLNGAINSWFDGGKNFTYRIEPCDDNPSQNFLKVSAAKIPVAPCSLVIGDIIQDFRSGLDHLAYALATAHSKSLTQEQARSSQFPIIGDESSKGVSGNGPAEWRGSALPRMICCIDPAAQAIIEKLQPYQLGGAFREHPLWWLRELSNIDKHRMLHIAAAYAAAYTVTGCSVSGEFTNESGIVDNDTVVARLGTLIPLDADKTVEMCVTPNMTVAFSDGPLAGKFVINTLASIGDYIATKVGEPLRRFL